MYKYRKGEYVVNSTKGSSMIEPMTYKRDVLVQVWVESRQLATLLKWLEGSGETIRFRSEIVRFTLDIALDNLIRDGIVEMVELAEEARGTLHSRFGAFSNPGGRGMKNAHHNLVLDGRRIESGTIGIQKGPDQIQSQVQASRTTGIDWEKIRGRVKEEEEKEARRVLEESMERIKEAGQIDEDGVITPMGKSSGVVYQEDMDAYKKREKDREETEEDEKSIRALEKMEEEMLEKIHSKEIENGEPGRENREDKEGESGGGDGGSDAVEREGTDAGRDSLQTG